MNVKTYISKVYKTSRGRLNELLTKMLIVLVLAFYTIFNSVKCL